MKHFTYTITDPLGIHARPAGLLAKEARAFPGTEITVSKDGAEAKASQLIRLMSLGIAKGDTVSVSAEGEAEAEAIAAMERFFRENL
ncbi:MAG: HPr family phosphocarrier protein [Clostridia bacterium]|nr:HPr family phosphocarrier protein [Clostridia bacterium]